MPGRLADRDVDSVTYAFVARARPARASRPGLAVQSPGRPRWRRPGHGHRPQHIRDPRRLKHAWVRRNLGYPKITTSRPSSPTAGGPFPGILPLSVILGSRIASTKGGLRSGVTHVTACANDGRASAAAAADRMILETRINASRMILPSHHPHLQTIVREMRRPVPASTHVAALNRCTFQGLTTGRVSVSVSGITAPAGRDLPEPSLSMRAHSHRRNTRADRRATAAPPRPSRFPN